MKFKNKPDLYLYSKNRKTCIGLLSGVTDLTADINFGTLSQMKFKIRKYFFFFFNGKWIKNPSYDSIIKNGVVYSTDETDYFYYKGNKLLDNYSIDYKKSYRPFNNNDDNGYAPHYVENGFQLQKETHLFNITQETGYNWHFNAEVTNGSYNDRSVATNLIACPFFVPVENGDVLQLLRYTTKYNSEITYIISYYSDNKPETFLGKTSIFNEYTPHVCREPIIFPDGYTKGYIRISGRQNADNSPYWMPFFGFVYLYSGERMCKSVSAKPSEDVKHGIPWWVIVDTLETKNGYNSYKEITLNSYEYVLSYKTFSTNEEIMPLYIPDEIVSCVTSEQMPIDTYKSNQNENKWLHCPQRMNRGLLNQILSYIPGWSLGYITPELMTKYRTIDDVDNANVYSFLMNTIQEKYQCYVIFNNDKKTINIISQENIFTNDSGIVLDWHNAIKEMEITNQDTSFVTAIRVHTEDDKYRLGLVNPTGGSIIYNFDSVINEMDYVVDENHLKSNDEPYTLKEAVQNYIQNLNKAKNGTYIVGSGTHKKIATQYIDSLISMTDYKAKLNESLTNYLKIADEINIHLETLRGTANEMSNSTYLNEIPPKTLRTPLSDYLDYKNQSTYNRLSAAVSRYWNVYNALYGDDGLYATSQNMYSNLKSYADRFSLNYETCKRIQESNNTYPNFLTPLEIIELSNYVIESDWTNENAVFNDDFDGEDVLDTLNSVYYDAKKDLDNIYSKPNYEFKVTVVNLLRLVGMDKIINNLFLGNSIYIFDESHCVNPVVLALHIDYDNYDNFQLTLSTDYQRKPKQFRFCDMFGTVNQISVETPTFQFQD